MGSLVSFLKSPPSTSVHSVQVASPSPALMYLEMEVNKTLVPGQGHKGPGPGTVDSSKLCSQSGEEEEALRGDSWDH